MARRGSKNQQSSSETRKVKKSCQCYSYAGKAIERGACGGMNNIWSLRAKLWKGLNICENTFKLVLEEKKPVGIWHRDGRKVNVS